MSDPAYHLRAELARVRPPHSSHGYPAELRSRVGDFVRREQANGRTVRELAEQLGISAATARRWSLEGQPSPSAFLPVHLVNPSAPLRLVTPQGYVVEGLAVHELASLLERLG
mgnify:CR=1 FL=1